MTEKRSLKIEKVPATTLVCIKWNGGGEVPAMLTGNYTSPAAAKQAIRVWESLNEREVEVEEPILDEDKARTIKRNPRKDIQPI